MNRAAIAMSVSILIGCNARQPSTSEDADVRCSLPAIGDECHVPEGEAEARRAIEDASPCPTGEIRPGEFVCTDSTASAGGYSLPDSIDYPMPDYSIYRCSGGAVTAVWRAVVVNGGGFYVHADECRGGGCQLFSSAPCADHE